MNDEQEVRRLLEAAVRDEPPLRLDRAAVISAGRRRLRIRRTAAVGGAATAVAAVVIGMTALSGTQFGMPEPVLPAGPGPHSAPGPTAPPGPQSTRTKEPPQTTASSPTGQTRTTVTTTTNGAPETPDKLSAALRHGVVFWPADVAVEGTDVPWNTFDAQNRAQFTLVTPSHARRAVEVVVDSYDAGDDKPPECGSPAFTCDRYTLPDGGTALLWRPAVVDADGPNTLELHAVRRDGVVVRVRDTAGFGPPWLPEPLLDRGSMQSIAMIPGFAAVIR
ncbi:hypothetical protein [Actinokineospora sp. NPDC004072]